MAIIKDLIAQAGFQVTPEGRKASRVFAVTAIDTAAPASIPGLAIQALIDDGNTIGSVHPSAAAATIYAGMTLRNFETVSHTVNADGGVAIIKVIYQVDATGSLPFSMTSHAEYDVSLRAEPTDVDTAGNQLKVLYWDKVADVGGVEIQHKQGITVNKLVPSLVMTLTKRVDIAAQAEGYLDGLANMMGKVNSDVYKGRAAKTVLFLSLKAVLVATPSTYSVTVVLEYRPEGWLQWSQYIDPNTGRPGPAAKKVVTDPSQVGTGAAGSNGWRGVEVYEAVSFASIGF